MISIIVPVYNSKEYLRECIDSIISQTYSNIEIIIVDDGSTDGSSDICEEFALKDERIRVVHQENQGLVRARKVGVSIAKGEWISFVDSDDWIHPNMVASLVDIAMSNGVDVVTSGMLMAIETTTIPKYDAIAEGLYEGKRIEDLKNNLFNIEDFFSFSILPYIWNKLWKRNLLEKTLEWVDDAIRVGEDVAIGFPTILQAKRIYITKNAFYYYRQNSVSMIRGKKNETAELKNTRLLIESIKNSYKKLGYYQSCRDSINRLCINQLFTRSYGLVNVLLDDGSIYPFGKVIPKSIIVYGAGAFGMAVYEYIASLCKIKNWIDKNAVSLRLLGYPINTIDEVVITEDDVVLVCVLSKKISNSICNELLKRGISKQQIRCFEITDDKQIELINKVEEY